MPSTCFLAAGRLTRPARIAAGLGLLACVLTMGCKSAETKCKEKQALAYSAWDAYTAKIESRYRKAEEVERNSQSAMAFEIERRISKIAEAEADRLYDRTNEAWHRAYSAAFNTACRQDPDCARAKMRNIRARRYGDDMQERIKAAKAARDAARGPAGKARGAAREVQYDFNNKELINAARAASVAAYEACREVKP